MQYREAAGPAQRPWHGGSDTVTPQYNKKHCLIIAEVTLNTNLIIKQKTVT